MKNKRKQSIVSVILVAAIVTASLFTLTARASVDDIVLKIKLLEPIRYTSVKPDATDAERQAAELQLRKITQTAYDAFIMDHPMRSMWIDIEQSKIEVFARRTGKDTQGLYTWTITELKNNIKTLPSYASPYTPAEMTDTLSKVVNSFIPKGDTLYDRVKSIHDYICELTVYTDPEKAPHVYSAYGALVDHRSVCEGYAEAFKLICDRNGIECILVSGKGVTSTQTENHMWNYVRMDDGQWYAVDATWDDGKNISSQYFLVGSETVVVEKNGTRFRDNHLPSGDISATNFMIFELPTLSEQSYSENQQASSDSSEDPILPPDTSSDTAPSVDKPSSGSVVTTGNPPSLNGTDSSSAENASLPESTGGAASVLRPAEQNDGALRSGSDHYYYSQLTPEQQNFYNALMSLVPPGSLPTTIGASEPPVSVEPPQSSSVTPPPPPETSEEELPPPVTSHEETDPPVITTEPRPVESSSQIQTLPPPPPVTSVTLPPDSQTPDVTSSGESDAISITVSGRPGEDSTGTDPLPPAGIGILDVVRIIVIVLALGALFGFVAVIILRFPHNDRK